MRAAISAASISATIGGKSAETTGDGSHLYGRDNPASKPFGGAKRGFLGSKRAACIMLFSVSDPKGIESGEIRAENSPEACVAGAVVWGACARMSHPRIDFPRAP